MERRNNQIILVFFIILMIALLYMLAPILTPFMLGALLAYLCNPLVKQLDKTGFPHLASVSFVFISLIGVVLLLVVMLVPIIQAQIVALIESLPAIMTWMEDTAMPFFKEFINLNTLKTTLPAATLGKTDWLFNTVWKSGSTLIDVGINIILTPVVTFYLLRDWDQILENTKRIIPKSVRGETIRFAHECDEVLSAFFRGQLLVMLALACIYGIGLSLTGLRVGLMIGVIGGLLSIVPYLGSTFVLVAATVTALVQFGSWDALFWVWAVFLIGQALEGYVLAPYLVGERIGLHPVAVIFAIMAGGALFGFFGVLLALPVAAVAIVFFRLISRHYGQELMA